MQSRWKSFEESLVNLVTGLVLGVTTNMIMLPILGMHPSTGDSVILTIVFAVLSIVRSYSIRRWYSRNK